MKYLKVGFTRLFIYLFICLFVVFVTVQDTLSDKKSSEGENACYKNNFFSFFNISCVVCLFM